MYKNKHCSENGAAMTSALPSLRERKRLQTADLLAERAMALFREKGFAVVTMDEIASGAEVSRGTLYSYFPVKEALLAHFFSQQMVAMLPRIMASLEGVTDPLSRLQSFLTGSAFWTEPYREFFGPYLAYRFAHPESPDSGSSRLFRSFLEEARAAGQLREDMPVDVLLDYLRNLVLAALNRWQAGGSSLPEEYRQMWQFFLQGAGRAAQ